MVLQVHLLDLNAVPVVGQEVEQRRIPIRAASEHAEYKIDIVIGKVAILLKYGDVEQPLYLPLFNRTPGECLEQVCPFALFTRRGKTNDALQTELPFFTCAPFEHGTYILIWHAGKRAFCYFFIYLMACTQSNSCLMSNRYFISPIVY